MIVRSIDEDNDWNFGQGRNSYKVNVVAVAQNIKTRLRSFYRDCFFAPNDGVDWFNLIGSKDFTALKLSIVTTILNTRYVNSLQEIEFLPDPTTRDIDIGYIVNTEYGVIKDEFKR